MKDVHHEDGREEEKEGSSEVGGGAEIKSGDAQ